jgi:glycosyltransferase involved in cell wall biosynthesis
MSGPPKVSVVMSVYNNESYLRESIQSILRQTFRDFEFIIIDDASTDNSWETLQAFASQDSRIRLIRNTENLGLTRSLNIGLKRAQGKYIARQDADDISMPWRFSKEVAFLDNNPQAVAVSGNVEGIDMNGRSHGKTTREGDPDLVAWFLMFYNHVVGHSLVMFRRQVAIELSGYDETKRYSQDYELWLRMAEKGDIALLRDALLQWRFHQDNISSRTFSAQEQIALDEARKSLTKLTARQWTVEEVNRLKQFWLGFFPDFTIAQWIHDSLPMIVVAFLNKRAADAWKRKTLAIKLNRVIGAQFYLWAKSLKNVRHKLTLYAIGFQWAPNQLVRFVFDDLSEKPYRSIRGLLKRLLKRPKQTV